MKKVIKLITVLFIVLLFFEFIAYIFKNSHNVQYNIKNKNNTFVVNEVYKNKKYYFLITNKKNKYSFEIDNKFHKKKNIIKEIIEYKANNYMCIYPVIKKTNNTNILCSKNGSTYSYNYAKDSLNKFVKILKNKGYNNDSWKQESNGKKELDTVSIFNNNIDEDTYIYIYKYDGFYTINKEKNKKLKLFKNDNYVNTLGTKVDNYYVVPNYDQKHEYKEFYIINMKNNKVKKRKYKKEISKDSYINGVINNEIYIFDKDELRQYKIYKKGKKLKEVGNKEDGVLYYNLKFSKKDVFTFRDKEMIFKTYKDYISLVEKKTTINYIQNDIDTFYYQTKDNNVYYYNTNSKQKVLLFNKKISDFILIKDTLFFISEDTLYSYNNNKGLKRLVTYSELQFNHKNRIAIYVE